MSGQEIKQHQDQEGKQTRRSPAWIQTTLFGNSNQNAVLTDLLHTELLSDAVSRPAGLEKDSRSVGHAAHELDTAIAVVRSSIQMLMLKRSAAEQDATGLSFVRPTNSKHP